MKKKSCFTIVTVVLSLVLLMSLGSHVWAMDYNEEVEKFVTSYFDVVDKSLSELSIASELSNYYETENSLEYVTLDTAIQHRKLQISDLHFSNYQTILSFEDISYKDGMFIVIVNKNTDMYFNCLKGEPSSIYEKHIISTKKLNDGSFRVVSDNYSDEIREFIKTHSNVSKSLIANTDNDMEAAKNMLLQESKENVAAQRAELEALRNNYSTNA